MLVTAVLAALPIHGIVVPGVSLGGLRLGDSQARVVSAWGRTYGRCTVCARPTWYFNYVRYAPQGAGVEFRGGRVAALFTLWSPSGWRTAQGVRIGDPAARVGMVYGLLSRRDCGTYDAFVLPRGAATTAFYVYADKVWGFGLMRAGRPACR